MFRRLKDFISQKFVADIPSEMVACFDCNLLGCDELNTRFAQSDWVDSRKIPAGASTVERRRGRKGSETTQGVVAQRLMSFRPSAT